MKLKERIEITKRGYQTLKTYTPGLIKAKLISAVAETLPPFATIWFSSQIINELTESRRPKALLIYVLAVVGIHFLLSMIKNVYDRIVDEKQADMWNRFMKIFTDKQMSMDYADLENQEIQKQRQKAEENLFMFGNGLAQLVWDTADIIKVPVGILASVSLTVSLFKAKSGNAVMDSALWILAIAAVVVMMGIVNNRLSLKEQKVFNKWTEGTVWFNRTFMFYGHELYDNTRRAKDVRIYGQEKIAERELLNLEEHNRNDNSLLAKMSSCQGGRLFAKGLGNAVCYLFVVAKAALGAFGVGNIVQYVGAFSEMINHAGLLTLMISENKVYTEHLAGLFEYLDLPNRKYQGSLVPDAEGFIRDNEHNREVKGNCGFEGESGAFSNYRNDCNFEIEFKNVSFRYPGSDIYALRDINTKLKIGQKQAFVGTNGAGKTTFVKLLCRLYDPTEGEILLNGIDIREYDYEEYLKLFSFVFQDFKLFSLTLGQNIAADLNYDSEKLEECLKKVSFYDRYLEMKDGPQTYLYRDISADGVEISGGEAQKLALARALYKDTPIIVLDEPTAALDPIAEAQVYEDFSRMVDNRTAVYISHRLSSCRFCDEITVFDAGKIVQKGTHEQLIKEENGQYYELWNAQAQYYRK